MVAAVSHAQYGRMGLDALAAKLMPGAVFADVKSAYAPAALQALGLRTWRL
jgi:UDP-N-acetyl-D-galactosamine dehydrogenase